MAHGQLRIVGRHRPCADDDRVRQRAHAVKVHDVVVARHELRVTRGVAMNPSRLCPRCPIVMGRLDVAEQIGRYRFNSSARASLGASSDRHPPPGDQRRTASGSSGFTGCSSEWRSSSERDRATGLVKWFRQRRGAADDAPCGSAVDPSWRGETSTATVHATMPHRLARLPRFCRSDRGTVRRPRRTR